MNLKIASVASLLWMTSGLFVLSPAYGAHPGFHGGGVHAGGFHGAAMHGGHVYRGGGYGGYYGRGYYGGWGGGWWGPGLAIGIPAAIGVGTYYNNYNNCPLTCNQYGRCWRNCYYY